MSALAGWGVQDACFCLSCKHRYGTRHEDVSSVKIGGPASDSLCGRWGEVAAYPVITNHMKIDQLPSAIVQQWAVVVKSSHMPTSLESDLSKAKRAGIARFNRAVMSEPEIKAKLGRGIVIYDGAAIAWSVNAAFSSLNHTLTLVRGPREIKVEVTFKKATEINLEVLHQYMEKRHAYDDSVIQCLTFLDALLAEGPKNRFPIVPNSNTYFDRSLRDNVLPLKGGVELLRGIFQSARPAIGTMSVNVDVAHTAFYQPDISVLDLIVANMNFQNENSVGTLNPKHSRHVQGLLRGILIYTKHIPRRNKAVRNERAAGLSKETALSLRFLDSNDKEVTVAQYFKTQYNIRLRYPNLPLLELLGPNNTRIPLELCFVAAGNKFPNTLLTSQQTSEIVKFAARPPAERRAIINQNVRSLAYNNDEHLISFGMKVSQEPMQAVARLLPPPELKFGPGRNPVVRPRDGKWNVKGQRLLQTTELRCWGIICVDTGNLNLTSFIRDLVNSAASFGSRLVGKVPYVVNRLRSGNLEDSIREAAIKTSQAFPGAPKPDLLIFVIHRTPNPEAYGYIKKICDCDLGIASQVVAEKNVIKAGSQLCDNLWLKINPKLGGCNVELKVNPFQRPTLILGADVSHPPPGRLGASMSSIVSLVSNVDPKATMFVGQARAQPGRMEMIEALQALTKTAINKFQRLSGIKKETVMSHGMNIVYYRDGVGEQQFEAVKAKELSAIKCAMQECGISLAKVTIVICQKRHHTRLFPANARDGDRNGNVKPGTLLDTGITHPIEFEFFLVSHSAIKGTARPTKYHVIYDEENWSAQALHTLTHNLCYTYARSTTSVSLVNVAYYAHLVGNRARAYKAAFMSDYGSSKSGPDDNSEEKLPELNVAPQDVVSVIVYPVEDTAQGHGPLTFWHAVKPSTDCFNFYCDALRRDFTWLPLRTLLCAHVS